MKGSDGVEWKLWSWRSRWPGGRDSAGDCCAPVQDAWRGGASGRQVGRASFLSACIFRFPFPLVPSPCLPCLPPPVPSRTSSPLPAPSSLVAPLPTLSSCPQRCPPFPFSGLSTAPCDAAVTEPSLPTSPFPLQSPPSPKLSPQWIKHGKSHGFSYFFSCLNTVLYSQNLKSK